MLDELDLFLIMYLAGGALINKLYFVLFLGIFISI